MKKIISRNSISYGLGFVACTAIAGAIASVNSQPVGAISAISSPNQSVKSQTLARANWQRYNSSTYRVSFQYPRNWKQVKDQPERFRGSDGSFLVSAMSTPSLQEGCRSLANHRLLPYGSKPKIQNLKIQGQSACLILPSADQTRDQKGESTLIVRYPKPVRVGSGTYSYFMLYADKQHIVEIAKTLKLTTSAR
ncbi:hypothetical protein H6F77_07250 [Microcoleus sp. FACHB-831]|uniref:hypothetical protein n=1 Tax=Microcoleus sp. FACHB-831 TaxID=2692827 RepID=UPI00168296AF|nr:hypothetical protein [Microcoleus sp. FACHB-831]MBD1920881.1 hypothetical protein [Microcoleus sp. FACHB-831]